MNWYFAKLVYRFVCGSGKHRPQFNEQIRMIEAEDSLHAFYKARLIGERESASCQATGLQIRWKFIDVVEIHPVMSTADGAEVFSTLHENDDADSYIKATQKKASSLLEEGIFEFHSLNAGLVATSTG